MIQARIHHGTVEVLDPIPPEWEGQLVNLLPLTPDDSVPDLNQRLAALQALGPAEFEPGEREQITAEMSKLDRISRDAMQTIAGRSP